MRNIIKAVAFALLVCSINFISAPAANAGCQDFPESTTPACIAENLALEKLRQEAYAAEQILVQQRAEQAARENAARIEAERAATAAADNALAPDDCARSTNRYVQRCTDIETARAVAENEARNSIRKVGELDALQKIANDKYTANKCDQAANQLLQVCIDSKAGADAVKNEAKNLAKKIIETQASLTKPLVDENGEIILTALLRSKTLSPKDIKAVLDTSSLSADDKKSLSAYAQTLNNLKSTRSASNFKIPLSKTLSEKFSSSTPRICLVVNGAVKTLKPGVCTINVTFSTESGFELQTSKKIVVRK
jgi:hypothetical protein